MAEVQLRCEGCLLTGMPVNACGDELMDELPLRDAGGSGSELAALKRGWK